MIKHIVIAATLGLSGLALVSGCVEKPIPGRADPHAPLQIDFTDDDLANRTAVGTPIVNRDAEGQLVHVTVPIRAATDKQLYIDYRVTFLDAYGQQVSATGWLNKTLAPNVYDQITFNSLSPRAADFRVDLRYAK